MVAFAEEVGQRDQAPFFNGAARAAEKLRAQLSRWCSKRSSP